MHIHIIFKLRSIFKFRSILKFIFVLNWRFTHTWNAYSIRFKFEVQCSTFSSDCNPTFRLYMQLHIHMQLEFASYNCCSPVSDWDTSAFWDCATLHDLSHDSQLLKGHRVHWLHIDCRLQMVQTVHIRSCSLFACALLIAFVIKHVTSCFMLSTFTCFDYHKSTSRCWLTCIFWFCCRRCLYEGWTLCYVCMYIQIHDSYCQFCIQFQIRSFDFISHPCAFTWNISFAFRFIFCVTLYIHVDK